VQKFLKKLLRQRVKVSFFILFVQLSENQKVQKALNERDSRVGELEFMLERYESDQPDKDKLLAAMESDKVAAALAVSQNQRLKVQLEELQDGFVKLVSEVLLKFWKRIGSK
jgi:hypothetical protein